MSKEQFHLKVNHTSHPPYLQSQSGLLSERAWAKLAIPDSFQQIHHYDYESKAFLSRFTFTHALATF